MIDAYIGGAAVTGLWFMLKVPPRDWVECAVSLVAVALWPLVYLYAVYCFVAQMRAA